MISRYPYTDNEQRNLDWMLEQITALMTEVEAMAANIGDITAALDRITALEDYCNRLHNGLNSQYTVITSEYTAAIAAESNTLINLMDSKDSDVKSWVTDQLAGLPGYYMYSPYTGIFETITDVMMELYESQRTGITATAYDALQMTATYYDGLNKTAYDYDMNGI